MSKVIGIDLGTTNSCVAVMEGGEPEYKLPFILSNWNGTSGDIDVLTHEFGHALEFYKSFFIESEFLSSISMETAEVHSMSMEFLAYPWIDLFFGDKTEEYKFNHIGCVTVRESVNKDILKTYDEKTILMVGASLKKEDVFWYETKQEDLNILDSDSTLIRGCISLKQNHMQKQ